MSRFSGIDRHEGGRSLDDIRRLVLLGEGLHIEFKWRVPDGTRVVKEISAFANTRGGRLLIGISDDGEVVGVRDAEEETFALHEALAAYCDPPVKCAIYRVPVTRRREVLLVEVPESVVKPHYVSANADVGKRTAYVRVDDMSVEASREAVRLMKSGTQRRDVTFEYGDKEAKLMRYLEEYGRITVEQFARLANVSRSRASQTLVLLTRARILTINLSPSGDFFTVRREAAA